VVSFIVRGLLIVSGAVTGWFVSKDAPNFSFIQGMVSLVVIAVIVLVLAYWPARWTHLLDRRNKPD
jgi:predicted signal transduction protein with EAL and GGDEF domain